MIHIYISWTCATNVTEISTEHKIIKSLCYKEIYFHLQPTGRQVQAVNIDSVEHFVAATNTLRDSRCSPAS